MIGSVSAIGEFGWTDLRDRVVRLESELPPPSEFEKAKSELNSKLASWRKNLSECANFYAHYLRCSMAKQDSAWLSQDDRVKAYPPGVSQEDLAQVDDLWNCLDELEKKTSLLDQRAADTRAEIQVTLQKLDAFNDVEALCTLANKEAARELLSPTVHFCIRRVCTLDPTRAVSLIQSLRRVDADNTILDLALSFAEKRSKAR